MDLRDLFDEVATDNEPPTGLSADRLYRSGRRKFTIKSLFTGTAGAAAVVAVVAAATTMLGGSGGTGRPANAPPSASADPAGVRWASAWDASHLYAGVVRCQGLVCHDQLLGSDDGGRIWTQRGADLSLSDTYVVGAQTLVATKSYERFLGTSVGGEGQLHQSYQVSTDGGRHWSDLTLDGTTAAEVSAGGYLMCVSPVGRACQLYAVDLAHLRAAPLATQPFGTAGSDQLEPQAAGSPLWAVDSSGTGGLEVSHDSGRTWQLSAPDLSCPPTTVWAGAQPGAAGVVCVAGPLVQASRTGDGGATWQRISMPAQEPFTSSTDTITAFMRQDGTVVVVRYPLDGSAVRFWSLSPGGTSWQALSTTGLPAYATVLEFDHDGSVLAHSSGLGQFDVYRTSDLRTWTKVTSG